MNPRRMPHARAQIVEEEVRLSAADGHVLDAYLARPAHRERGALVIVQETFGVTEYVRSACDRFALQGYAAIAPAIYDRQKRGAVLTDAEPESLAEARRLRRGLVWKDVLADVSAAIERVRGAGRVGIVGYCVGGSIAWLAAASLPLAAASAYYGRDIVNFLDRRPRCPVELHFGESDPMIPQGDVERIRAVYPGIPAYIYPADHGFDGPGERHHAESARLARERTLAFVRAHVG